MVFTHFTGLKAKQNKSRFEISIKNNNHSFAKSKSLPNYDKMVTFSYRISNCESLAIGDTAKVELHVFIVV